MKPLIDTLEATGKVPPELQPILDEMKTPTGQIAALFASSAGYALVGGAVGKLIDAALLPLAYAYNKKTQNVILTPDQYLMAWLRDKIAPEYLKESLYAVGLQDSDHAILKDLTQIRLDPATITRIWLRDKEKYEKLWKDLKQQGWTEDRIEVAKELAKIIPPLPDMVRFADYSAFDPEVIERWREFYDAPDWIRAPFSLLGVEADWADKYWFSHWVQPGRFELSELHRRDLISDDDVKLAYRTMGYSPFWQEYLLKLVRAVPTRVDVRRWWDMRTIDEARLREVYHAQGYYDKDLDDYVLWTKVYVAFPDLIARWKNGYITVEEVKTELTGLGMPAARVDEMIETKMKAVQPERTAKERDLTKSEIVKGVKKELIGWDEGVELLTDLGYDNDEADYILSVNIAVEAGSPETYAEFKELTQKWRLSTGVEAKPMPEELKLAAAEVLRLTKEVASLSRSIEDEKRGLIAEEVLPEETTARLKELQVSLHRGEAELARVRSEYDKRLAEWRHKVA
ncbi:hypothetical protein ES703_93759 [subsurface metagenome]